MNSPAMFAAMPRPIPRLQGIRCTLVLASALRLLASAPAATPPPVEYLDTSFENASPLWYEVDTNGIVQIYLTYDHERASPNRAAGHIHFCLQGQPGAQLRLEFNHLDNVWNGKPGSIAPELKTLVVSANARHWTVVPTEAAPGDRVGLTVTLPGPRLYVARVEPYRLSDLDRRLEQLRRNPRVRILPIGHTVQGRPLELIRVGRARAPYRVVLRARAHAWEAAGNWVIEGLLDRLCRGDADARRFLDRYCVYVLPIANKDGVAAGRTRFNLLGKDLNRDWNRPADPALAPENAALERWLESMIAAGRRPHLALDLHNDGGGRLHLSRPPVSALNRHLDRMAVLEQLLRRHTWFTEGSTPPSFVNSGTLGDGWLERFDIDAAIHEFHCNWIAGLNEAPLARHWKAYGASLAEVFYEYLGTVHP